MDARRFDRNADQISQILGHYRKIRTLIYDHEHDLMLQSAIVMLDSLLEINDKLGESAEKGLI